MQERLNGYRTYMYTATVYMQERLNGYRTYMYTASVYMQERLNGYRACNAMSNQLIAHTS